MQWTHLAQDRVMVAGSCEHIDEPSSCGTMKLVSYPHFKCCISFYFPMYLLLPPPYILAVTTPCPTGSLTLPIVIPVIPWYGQDSVLYNLLLQTPKFFQVQITHHPDHERTSSFKATFNIYQTTWHKPEVRHLHTFCVK